VIEQVEVQTNNCAMPLVSETLVPAVGEGLFAGPVGPVAPVAPLAPVDPVEPVAPVVPVAPVGPVAPVEPLAPAGPVAPLVFSAQYPAAPLANVNATVVTLPVAMVGAQVFARCVCVEPVVCAPVQQSGTKPPPVKAAEGIVKPVIEHVVALELKVHPWFAVPVPPPPKSAGIEVTWAHAAAAHASARSAILTVPTSRTR
jgi:hypothetical protein